MGIIQNMDKKNFRTGDQIIDDIAAGDKISKVLDEDASRINKRRRSLGGF